MKVQTKPSYVLHLSNEEMAKMALLLYRHEGGAVKLFADLPADVVSAARQADKDAE